MCGENITKTLSIHQRVRNFEIIINMKSLKFSPLNFIVFLSAVTLTVIFSLYQIMPVYVYIIQPIFASAVWGYFIFYRNLPESIIKSMRTPDIILAILGVIGFCVSRCECVIRQYNFMINISNKAKVAIDSLIESYSAIGFVIGNLSFFIGCILMLISVALFFIFVWLSIKIRPIVVDLFKKMDKIERIFLYIVSILLFFFSAFLFSQTNIFYLPSNDEINKTTLQGVYDIIYTSDSGIILYDDAYLNPQNGQNDIRQPLFGIFSLPFASIIKTVSLPFRVSWLYPLLLNFLQIFLLLISVILVVKMLKINNAVRKLLILMLFASSYSVILFCFMMEQYIFSVWWLTLFLYFSIENKRLNIPLLVAASGSLITSVVLALPFVSYYKNIKDAFVDVCKFILIFISCMFVFGLINTFFNSLDQTANLVTSFGGKTMTGMDKLCQFTNFIPNMFTAPKFFTTHNVLDLPQIALPLYTTVNYFGICILLFAVAGFCLDYKNMFKKTCFIWLLFSVLLLFIVGYGSNENGMILYSLYFLWAFMSLMVSLINRLLGKFPVIEYGVYIIATGYMLYCNIQAMIDIFNFGLEHYPI